MKQIAIIFGVFIVAGSFLTSCHYNPVVVHPCDTCKTDTSHHPCDTCKAMDTTKHYFNKDSLAHAFTWQEYTIPGLPAGTGVSVFGPNDMIIVAYNLYHFDGTNFTDMHPIRNGSNTPMDGAISDFNIFAFSNTDFWLIDGIAFHTSDGKYFDDLRPGGAIRACWGTSSNDMFFVCDGGLIYHYNGTKFDSMVYCTTKDLGSVWGTSHNDVWACGFNYSTGETVIVHYDGNSWSIDNLSNDAVAKTGGLIAVWTCDSANTGHRFVATSGAYVYRKTDNGIWRNDIGLIPNALGGNTFVGLDLLSGNSPNDIMATGGWGWVGHWNGKTWKKYDALYDYNNVDYNSRALSMKGNTACVVGTKGGSSWVAIGTRKQ